MSAEPLRHYFVGDPDTRRTCARDGCGRDPSDPVHLNPGDEHGALAAIAAATHPDAGGTPEEQHATRWTPGATRWTFGTATTSASEAGATFTVGLGPGAQGPREAG